MTAAMSMPPVSMPVPALVSAVIMPMVAVFIFMAVAYDHLIEAVPVTGIPCANIGIMPPGARLVYNHLVPVIQIVITPSCRQIRTANPHAIVLINILKSGYVIEHANIRHIIIVGTVVPDRPPFRLTANIYPNAYVYLGIRLFK